MQRLHHVPVAAMDARRFETVIAPADHHALLELLNDYGAALRARVIWNVSSTASGGGVAELLTPLLGYSRGAGVDARWVVISGDPTFFGITKRLHNHLHGAGAASDPLGPTERSAYERTLAGNAAELVDLVRPRDVVILHDPQTAGLLPSLRHTGAQLIWRCHVGLDQPNDRAREAWHFLRPYVRDADAYVFSRRGFVWDGLDRAKIFVIQPSIDVFSPKNAAQSRPQTAAILAQADLTDGQPGRPATFIRGDGTPGRITHRAQMTEGAPLRPAHRVVTQVSRWDSLKDPLGVLSGFAQTIAPRSEAHLLLAGPDTAAVADDPEGAAVFGAVREARAALPPDIRARVHLASLPMDDVEENAAIVNAAQRQATVVVQKSLAEGFGLTVAEAMWKERPVVASRVGGIQDQIVDGQSGVLIADPHDLTAFGEAVVALLDHPGHARRVGVAARLRIRDHFLVVHHLGRYFELIQHLTGAAGGPLRAPIPVGSALTTQT